MAYIGTRLRQARGKVTQEELAIRTGIARTDLSGIENDRISVGPKRLRLLADALDVSVLELSPEVEPDERGQDLLARLAELAETVGDLLQRQKKTEREMARLRARVRGLEAPRAAGASAPKRRQGRAAN